MDANDAILSPDLMTTWQRERQQRLGLFAATMDRVAAEWGSDWIVSTQGDSDCATLMRVSDGLTISAWHTGKGIRFFPRVPRPKNGSYLTLSNILPYEIRAQGKIEATVNGSRPVAVIARDIMRRVVKPYSDLYHYVTEYHQQRQESADQKAAVVARIVESFPNYKPRQGMNADADATTSLYRYGGVENRVRCVNVSPGGSVALELSTLTVEQALAVLEVLEAGK